MDEYVSTRPAAQLGLLPTRLSRSEPFGTSGADGHLRDRLDRRQDLSQRRPVHRSWLPIGIENIVLAGRHTPPASLRRRQRDGRPQPVGWSAGREGGEVDAGEEPGELPERESSPDRFRPGLHDKAAMCPGEGKHQVCLLDQPVGEPPGHESVDVHSAREQQLRHRRRDGLAHQTERAGRLGRDAGAQTLP